MMGLSLGHIIILLVVVMLFGPKRVAALGEQLGKSLRGLRESVDNVKQSTGLDKFGESMQTMRAEVDSFKDSIHPLKTGENPASGAPAEAAAPETATPKNKS